MFAFPLVAQTLFHVVENTYDIDVAGLFQSGEGAGFAGGIVSAEIDGERCAEKVIEYITR